MTWIVGFCPANSVWWHRWLKPGYAHCWAFSCHAAEDGSLHWLVMDPAFEGVQVRLAGPGEIEGWFTGHNLGTLKLMRVEAVGAKLVRPRWFMTCAGAVAAVLGLRETPLTPWRLACRLRRLGAEEIA